MFHWPQTVEAPEHPLPYLYGLLALNITPITSNFRMDHSSFVALDGAAWKSDKLLVKSLQGRAQFAKVIFQIQCNQQDVSKHPTGASQQSI